MINLLQETIDDIYSYGKTPDDIIFIGSTVSGCQCIWEEFMVLADKEYDDGFGGQEVANDLVIVFSDMGRMRRREYDGSEWWEYLEPFIEPDKKLEIKGLFVNGPLSKGKRSPRRY